MQWISDHSVHIIFAAFTMHVLLFVGLVLFRKREVVRLKSHLEDILGPKFRRTSMDPDRTIDEAIDGFFHDIRDVISAGEKDTPARELSRRLLTKDEERKYLRRRWFETVYNVVRTGIEAYPLMGILGTVLAIGVGLNTAKPQEAPGREPAAVVRPLADGPAVTQPAPGELPPSPANGHDAVGVARASADAIVGNFKNAIWSTVWGLVFGLFFMLLNAWFEPGFERLSEHRNSIREAVRASKIVLIEVHEGEEA